MKIEKMSMDNCKLFVRIKYDTNIFDNNTISNEEFYTIDFNNNDTIDCYEMIVTMSDKKEEIENIVYSIEKPLFFNKANNDKIIAFQFAYINEDGFSRWFNFPNMEKWVNILNNRF